MLPTGVMTLAASMTVSIATAQSRLISSLDGVTNASTSANGDSFLPVVSADGRYVLFASTANNLSSLSGTNPLPLLIPPRVNVYLRDRVNATTALVSVNETGDGGGNGDSWPVATSTNGRYVLFESAATNLVSADTNGANDIFLRDLVEKKTLLVSANVASRSAGGESRSASMTPDARFVAFVSAASDLVSGDTNRLADVFVRDMQSGTTVLASVGARSTSPTTPVGGSGAPVLSADGRYVAFYSTATNLVAAVRTSGEVYARDLVEGKTIFVSTGARAAMLSIGGKTNAVVSFNHAISDDGRFIAYTACSNGISQGLVLRYGMETGDTQLVSTNAYVPAVNYEYLRSLDITGDGRFIAFVATSNYIYTATTRVGVWDANSGTISLASGDTNGVVEPGSAADSPSLDASGRYVAFIGSANITGQTVPGEYHVYVRDLEGGQTLLVGQSDSGGIASASPAAKPSISADGVVVAFETTTPDLVVREQNRASDVFVQDRTQSAPELVSKCGAGLESLAPNGSSSLTRFSVSSNGQFVAFASEADNLVSEDRNSCSDVFLRDIVAGTNLLVSVQTNGVNSGNGISVIPSVTGDGRFVVFASGADNLVVGDTNRSMDVFVRDTQLGETRLVSTSSDGSGPANKDSYAPIVSQDGRFVLFRSKAKNLVAGVVSGYENLFLRDLQLETNYALTTSGAATMASMTPDGRRVAYAGGASSQSGPLYVWDSLAASRIYTNATTGISAVTISPDGKRVAYWQGPSAQTLFVWELADGSSVSIDSTTTTAPAQALAFSGDGKLLAYADGFQLYIWDLVAQTNRLVSARYDGSGPGNGSSDFVEFSSDGRFLAFRSQASDLIPSDLNGVPDVFLYEVAGGSLTLLSLNKSGSQTGDNRSLRPVFSADAKTVFLQSWASDLGVGDANLSGDIFGWSLYAPGEVTPFPVQIMSSKPGLGAIITWPVVPGKSYRVQFKDDLQEPGWRDTTGSVILGDQGWYQDGAATSQRFYRVVAF